ncbi:hypothetical protein AB0C02_24400 [Micromonospora sp. NPDC048999]|uniref:hypothetical protein n=1 Tax=Micromonospora sp. NPDC048999 TaxID=3155391 RepID=UPI0033E9266C
MTVGELLDAATTLLRTRVRLLLGVGFLVALLEQVVLFPLRQAADVTYLVFPHEDRWGWYALLLLVGFGTEMAGIAVLGAFTSGAGPRALLGAAAPARPVPVGRAALLALTIGLFATVAGATVVAGPVVFLLLGLVMPALVIDRLGPGRALLRSMSLSVRRVLRAGWIRLLGYLSWLFIRLATGIAGWAALGLFLDTGTAERDHLATGAAWLLVNTLAYPTLACLDTVLHLDLRMRTEGLDLGLRRALSRRVSCDAALAVPR